MKKEIKKALSLKTSFIISLIIIGITSFFLENHYTLLTQGELQEAQIVGCDSKTFKHSSGSSSTRRNVTNYTPIAVSQYKEKATGTVWYKKNWCKKAKGNTVQIYVHPTDNDKNRIATFIQFWFIPSAILTVALLITLSAISIPLTRLVFLAYVAIAAVSTIQEFKIIDLQKNKSEQQTTEEISVLSLDQCVRERMEKKNLQNRSQVKYLICQDSGINDLSSIADLTNLEELYLQGNELQSLETIPALTKLKTISVANNKPLTTLKGIEKLSALEELQSNHSNIEDIQDIKNLQNLRIIGLMKNKITDISAFSNLNNIEDATLSYNSITDISALANKPKLKDIQIYGNAVNNITALYQNTSMKIVGIRGKGNVPCNQIRTLRSKLSSDAKVFGQKSCD